jgi:hypothetical protein
MMINLNEGENAVARTVVEFCRFAREKGLSTGVHGTLAALQAAAVLGVCNQEDMKLGLRSTLCSSKDDWDLFEKCFQMFWRGSTSEETLPNIATHRRDEPISPRNEQRTMPLLSTGAGNDAPSQEDGGQSVTGASAREQLTKVDFSTLPKTDMEALEQISLRLFEEPEIGAQAAEWKFTWASGPAKDHPPEH